MNKANDQINPIDRNRYSVIPRVLIFLFKDNAVLLIKGAATKKLWPGKYNGLGGHLEKGEDPLGAARRELKEESGLVCESLDLCGTVIVDTGSSPGVAIYIYRGEYKGGELRASLEGMPEWIPLDQIDQIPVVEDLHAIIPLITHRKPGDRIISAKYFYDSNDQFKIEFTE